MFDLQPHGPETYVGIGPRNTWGGLHGGQIVAQALRAAAATVEAEFAVHSLRAYFIRRGDHAEPVPDARHVCAADGTHVAAFAQEFLLRNTSDERP